MSNLPEGATNAAEASDDGEVILFQKLAESVGAQTYAVENLPELQEHYKRLYEVVKSQVTWIQTCAHADQILYIVSALWVDMSFEDKVAFISATGRGFDITSPDAKARLDVQASEYGIGLFACLPPLVDVLSEEFFKSGCVYHWAKSERSRLINRYTSVRGLCPIPVDSQFSDEARHEIGISLRSNNFPGETSLMESASALMARSFATMFLPNQLKDAKEEQLVENARHLMEVLNSFDSLQNEGEGKKKNEFRQRSLIDLFTEVLITDDDPKHRIFGYYLMHSNTKIYQSNEITVFHSQGKGADSEINSITRETWGLEMLQAAKAKSLAAITLTAEVIRAELRNQAYDIPAATDLYKATTLPKHEFDKTFHTSSLFIYHIALPYASVKRLLAHLPDFPLIHCEGMYGQTILALFDFVILTNYMAQAGEKTPQQFARFLTHTKKIDEQLMTKLPPMYLKFLEVMKQQKEQQSKTA